MTLDLINLGSEPNDGTGDDLRTAGQKINAAIIHLDGLDIGGGTVTSDGIFFTTVDALLGATSGALSYTGGGGTIKVSAGDRIRTFAEGFAYEVVASGASGSTNVHVTTTGGVKMKVIPQSDGAWNVKAFGAKADGTTDDTAAFNAAIQANPAWAGTANITSLGRATIHVPRGRYLVNGTVQTGTNAAGIVIRGEGPRTTLIERTNDSGSLFSFAIYSFVEICNLALVHNTASARSSWANRAVTLNGNGGGQKFAMRDVQVNNFDRVINLTQSINEDTFYFERCRFRDSKTVFYCRNPQALINKFTQCTWGGNIDRAFDVTGFGYTHIDTANVVIPGAFFYVGDADWSSGPSNQLLMTNAKFEYTSAGTIRIIEMADANMQHFFKLVNCGITSANSPDPDTYQFDMQGTNYILHVDGGDFVNVKIRTRGRPLKIEPNHRHWIKFENLTRSPAIGSIERIGAAGSQQPPVIFKNCGNRFNVTMLSPYLGGNDFRAHPGPIEPTVNTITHADGIVRSGTQTYHFNTYGQLVEVRSVRLLIAAKGTTLGATMKVFTDAAKNNQIGSDITVTNTAPAAYEVTIPPGTFTSEGVFVEIERTGANNGHGRLICETVSV